MPSYSPRPSVYGVDTSVSPTERYRIVGRIAMGGMAEIYLSRMMSNAGVEREVVLKRLLPELQADSEFVQMFHDEATIASQLTHPNIVQIYELGEIDGSMFIAMELLRGVNLRDLLARLHADNRKIPIELGTRICCGALEALAYAHSFADRSGRHLNVVHRDVSPQNIIVTYEGTVKLVDFGVAKAEGKLHQTRAGLVKGKFAYMSPEQISGGTIDGRSDLFALAEVFYELILQRHPFFAETDMDVLRAILDAKPPHPAAIDQSFPSGLADILMKSLRKESEGRYPDAAAFQDALEHFLLENGTPATSIKLGRFVRELFDDRMRMEQKARETGDDDLLIEAMTVGRAERGEMSGSAAPVAAEAEPAVVVPSDYDEDEHEDATLAGHRVDVNRHRPVVDVVQGPAVEENETFDAYDETPAIADPSEAGEGGVGFQSEIRGLFEGEEPPSVVPVDNQLDTMPPEDDDAAEMPTMLGTLSAEEMAEVRNAASHLRRDGPSVQGVAVGPAKIQSGPVITRSSQPTSDPADAPRNTPAPFKPPPQQRRPTPPPQVPQQPVTTRSETVLQGKKRPTDKWGIWFFIAGLGALVGALIYAGILIFGSSEGPTMSLVIRSTPPGAAIYLDGFDTGARTPKTIPQIAADKPHAVELRLDGFRPFKREIPVEPELAGEPYVIHWRFQPMANPGGDEQPK